MSSAFALPLHATPSARCGTSTARRSASRRRRASVQHSRPGASTLEFGEDDGAPFYHFALLVPGDRFEAARRWAAARLPLLPGGDLDGVVWEFSNWDALACYFHDPAGNIVELIAHRGLAESGRSGAFEAGELVEVSELGLVGEPQATASALARLQLELYDGTSRSPTDWPSSESGDAC